MREHLDLGVLDGPVLVFGGPYGNLEATRALQAAARALGIPGAHVICTGDVVAYGADPQATVDLVREWGCTVVMGNCEEALAADAADCGCNFNQGSACAALSAHWFAATRRDLDAEARRWMGNLPRRIAFTLGGRRLTAVHGGASQINKWVFASTPAAEKLIEIAATQSDGVIAGHCGLPFTQILDGWLWHNSGALGLPANDATPRVWFSVLRRTLEGIEIAHHALAYDHAAAARKMRARGYPLEYADSLGAGLWPSCDILPAAERAARGRALAPVGGLWVREPLPAAAD
jgi:predicted phosphodiesterase